ncbi:sugar ABC transporter ATP-binding protein [Plantactinospora siamensis]|uniref:Sugar ABC transporter ATP-binding protein n=1 Tax=Plantactinospora siamensis TaxID=555372 RepID=A0ABV6P4M4_9ACTN
MSAAERPVVLRLDGIVKTFPGVRALDGVQLEVRAGEVHCLLGQNGAGKSTLIKVLAGVHRPDAGELRWQGERVSFGNPQAATRAGIATIYQELDLVEDLTVAENVFLGHEHRTAGFVRRRRMRRDARAILGRLGHPEIPAGRAVGRLPAAAKQIVSMARALSYDARLIVMDEPSAVLAHDEVANLFRVIREMTAQGIAVIYISHRLEEIREIGDRVTVLKDGRTSAVDLPARDTPTAELVSRMTGRSIEYVFPPRGAGVRAPGAAPLLEVTGLTRHGEFTDVSLTVHPGEILGIAGLVGSGRSELLETVYGARRAHAGRVRMAGRTLPPGRVGPAVRAGIGMAPEERKSQALLLDEPIYRNITLAGFGRYATAGLTHADRERAVAARIADALALHPRDVRRTVRTLSGGNQQKVVLGRWLLGGEGADPGDPAGAVGSAAGTAGPAAGTAGPAAGTAGPVAGTAGPAAGGVRLLLLDEPTRGVDVGARAELYQVIRRLADSGVGVLLVSSEVPEVLGLADRVLVMREGRLVHEAPAAELTEETVLDLVMAGSLLEVTAP